MTSKSLAPIALFVYNRPDHLRQTLDYLRQNKLADQSELFVFSDGPKSNATEADIQKMEEVRQIIQDISGFKKSTPYFKKENHGLANSIIAGVTKLVNEFGKVIVLEDDMITSRSFLSYLNWGINTYSELDDVVSIHAYNHPTREQLPDTFFMHGADCWGWATWTEGWKTFNANGQELLDEILEKELSFQFDMEGAVPYTQMLRDQIQGLNNSWAIRWYASAFLAKKLTLYSGISYVFNAGFDGSGTHCGEDGSFNIDVEQLNEAESHPIIEARHNDQVRKILSKNIKQDNQPSWTSRFRRIRQKIFRS